MIQIHPPYIDEYQNIHHGDEVLGQGGQGIVFRTKDPDLAIKVFTDATGKTLTDSRSIRKCKQRLKYVRLLPLPEGVNISVPAALLENNAGYVMQLLSEMVPLSRLWLDGKSAEILAESDIPRWLSEVPESEAKKIVHYCNTGGLRRRLTVLYKCATILARLHGSGLVYGDLSPNNIYISEDNEYSSVWLIDADNIRYEMLFGGSGVYTPKYGSPELVQGLDGGRPASDCYAFAVVAFYLLALIHPFVGKLVDGTSDRDWADDENANEDIEEQAYAGLLPWVDDQSDDANSTDAGLPRQLLLTEKLKALFQRTFSGGRTTSWLRPSIFHWPEALAQAADATIQCPTCDMSYFYDYEDLEAEEGMCPYCGTLRPEIVMLESYRWHGNGVPLEAPCWRFVREIKNNSSIPVPRRLFSEFTMTYHDSSELEIKVTNNSILINKSEQGTVELSIASESHDSGRFQVILTQMEINRADSQHQFWMYANSNDPRLILCTISGDDK